MSATMWIAAGSVYLVLTGLAWAFIYACGKVSEEDGDDV
jgi:hypothetical protein